MAEQAPWLVANRYEVGDVVGRGGYGMVCRGVDRKTGQAIALKMLSPEAGRDPDVVERMLREQQALVALSGTCAVTAIDLCRLESGAPCLIMEWLEGRDLEQELAEQESAAGHGDQAQLLRTLQPLVQTLAKAHEIGLVHRDIKPANVFVTSGTEPGTRLLDFGLSRMKNAAPLTQIGMVMGSPSYISPETWRGNSRELDGRADLFSLAVIVFRWLTGKLPFDAPDLIGKMNSVTTGPRPSVLALRPDLPKAVDSWMARALAVEPDARYQTAPEFYAALEAALNGVELPFASADASGVRARTELAQGGADGSSASGPLSTAWRKATSLLKRFTGPRETPVPVAPHSVAPPANETRLEPLRPKPSAPPAAPEAVREGDRHSVWLDSSELEDAALESVRAAAESPPNAPAPAKKGKGKGHGKRKDKDKPKRDGPSKPESKRKPGKKARGKKRKR